MKKIGIIAVYKEDQHGAFSRLYHDYIEAIESTGTMVVHIIPCNTRHMEYFIGEMDGFILPGGDDIDPSVYGQENIASNTGFVENDKKLLLCIDQIVASKKPLFGVCKGMQLLNIYFGGTLTQDIPNSDLHDQGSKSREYIHEVLISFESKLKNIIGVEKLQVNSIHHQAIDVLGEGLEVVATSQDGYIEAIEHKQYPQILAVQWHPELLKSHQRIFHTFFDA